MLKSLSTIKIVNIFAISVAVTGILGILSKKYSLIGGSQFTLIFMIAIGICVFACTRLINDFEFENIYFKFIFALLIIYHLYIIFSNGSLSYGRIKEYLQNEYMFWPYIIPIFVFFDKRIIIFVYLTRIISYIAIVGIIWAVLQPGLGMKKPTAEAFFHSFAFACGFLLLNARYLPKLQRWVSFLALLAGTIAFVYTARRNAILSYASLMLAAAGLHSKNLNASKFFKIFPIIAGVLIFALMSSNLLPSTFTKKLDERLSEDTRTYVFESLFADMKEDEIFGKGMDGSYYCPMGGGETESGEKTELIEYRKVIENGWYQQYLKGGIVYMVLFGLVLLPAVFLGFFKSNNQMAQSFAIMIFFWLVDMAIYGLPRLTMEYILVWIGVGACYKQSFREITNEEIEEVFTNYKDYENTLVH